MQDIESRSAKVYFDNEELWKVVSTESTRVRQCAGSSEAIYRRVQGAKYNLVVSISFEYYRNERRSNKFFE